VDYLVKCIGDHLRPEELDAVEGAEEMLCDSKPLVFLARLVGVDHIRARI
jgi:hypothetical protein